MNLLSFGYDEQLPMSECLLAMHVTAIYEYPSLTLLSQAGGPDPYSQAVPVVRSSFYWVRWNLTIKLLSNRKGTYRKKIKLARYTS